MEIKHIVPPHYLLNKNADSAFLFDIDQIVPTVLAQSLEKSYSLTLKNLNLS